MKCDLCGFEWIEKEGQTLEICPICKSRLNMAEKAPAEATAAETMKDILKKYGVDILGQKERFIGLFGDFAPKLEFEKRLLQHALTEKTERFFINCKDGKREENAEKALKALLELFNEDTARKITELFISAFGWNIEPEMPVIPEKTGADDAPASPVRPDSDDKEVPADEGIRFKNGIYKGAVSNGKRNGYGEMIFDNGEVYTGQWENDKRNGKGTLVYPNGNVYEGMWKNNKRCGNGKMTYSSGDVYEGQWDNDVRCGNGTMSYHNNDRYTGEWKSGKRSGSGTLICSNGDKYIGEWQNGKRCGKGKLISKGKTTKGIWENDKFIKKTLF